MPTPTRRGFSNVATPVTLVGTLAASGSSAVITVSATPSGWPATLPYFAVIDLGTASEEVVQVTAQAGTSMTITRGGSLTSTYGSTTKAHSNGATISHVATAQDYDEANAHTNASTGVHGITGAVVGTTDTQTLTNKTLGTGSTIGNVARANVYVASSNYTMLATDEAIFMDTGASPRTLTLVAPSSLPSGKLLKIRTGDSALTVNRGGVTEQFYPGLTSLSMQPHEAVEMYADGTNWVITSRSYDPNQRIWTPYTPTFTNVTGGAGTFAYKIVGKTLFLRYEITAGTSSSTSICYFSLPSGVSTIGTKQGGGGNTTMASWMINPSNTSFILNGGTSVTSGNSVICFGSATFEIA